MDNKLPILIPSGVLNDYGPMLTLGQIKLCEEYAERIMDYRSKLPTYSSCWSDEWPVGYFCAMRDFGIISRGQWAVLCAAFQQEE